MDFTGERFVPGVQGPMKLEHLQRYASVRPLVRGRRVADIASGEGYGAAMLAREAARVVGVDMSIATVQHARTRYGDVANVGFVAGRCEALPLATGSIDVIVSFETIEHLDDHEACLDEFKRVLAPGGRLVISTPDASQYVTAKDGNPFHVHELTLAEFKALVEARFRDVRFWGQRPAIATFTYALGQSPSPAPVWRALRVEGDAVADGVGTLPKPEYAVAVCSDGSLDDLALDTVIIEPADDAYASLLGIIHAYQAQCERLEQARSTDADTFRQNRDAWLAQKEALAVEKESLTDELNRRALVVAHVQHEFDIVVQSRSWRLTAPLRDARQSVGRRKHAMALGIERRLRTVFRNLPLRGQWRWKLKTAVFERTGWLMRGTASYQHWHGTQRRAMSASRAAVPSARRTLDAAARLSTAPDPVVSVVIPAYGQVEHTRCCLASLAAHPPAVAWEVILVDDASPEDLREVFSTLDGLTVVRNETNVGFIHSCNRGAREARGRYLCFLNNDTEVTPGWCDELLATLGDVPDAGLVGAKLLYPDGSLQEAGGIIWRDGSGWNVGKFEDPARPEYSYRRDVDYVSGAAIMLPASLFWELGGFDTDYAPAYGEDSDLAFKVRAAGRRVLMQPLSVVIHHEGATAGTDLSSGVKSYQVRNQQRLATRWAPELSAHLTPGEDVRRARERGIACRALVLDLCTPEPDKDAGSITAFNIMDILQRLGCGVTFAPVDNFLFLDRYTTALQRRGVECLYAPFVTSIEDYLEANGKDFDLVLIFRFVTAARHLEAVRKHAPRASVWLHTSDLHFLREQREAELRGDSRMAERALAMKQEELRAIADVDCTIVHSTFEQELLAREAPEARVAVFGWAIDAPGTSVPFTARRDIGFIGGYQHPPNVDAALYFARDILPRVREVLPDVRFHVIGSNPPDHLRALAGDAVSVTGFVPDLVPVLDGLRLSVAPLRYGAGIKGKIGTSLGHGLPCVATPLGAEGMELDPEREVLVADTPQAFADAVVRLYTDPALWQRMSDAGVTFVRQQYSFDSGTTLFHSLLTEGGLPGAPPAPVPHDGLEMAVVTSADEDRAYRLRMQRRFAERARIEASLVPESERPFGVRGFCIACREAREFAVTYDYALTGPGGTRTPNWREHLVCVCGLNARTRAAVHLLTTTLAAPADARVYVMEQRSRLHDWLAERFPNLVGSEYLGEAVPAGRTVDGIRNEDATRLTFADAQFDVALSFDVFEHVPDFRAAFREACRILAPGGTLLFTAPFDRGSEVTVTRARLSATGAIEHLLDPEYHGDPNGPDGRILCFQHFGWDVISMLAEAGFSHAEGRFLWSRRLGYLGEEQALFLATK